MPAKLGAALEMASKVWNLRDGELSMVWAAGLAELFVVFGNKARPNFPTAKA